MNVFAYLGHPAHYYLFSKAFEILRAEGHSLLIGIKSKDVLEELVRGSGHEYINLYPGTRRSGRLLTLLSMLQKDKAMFAAVRAFRADVLIGTSVEITHVGKLLHIPSVVFNEDDWDVVREFSYLAYPFASRIVAPRFTRMGRWSKRTTFYTGYHELAYLHPDVFIPASSRIAPTVGEEPYSLIRLSQLGAYHDRNARGISLDLCWKTIETLNEIGRVWISSEADLPEELTRHRLSLDPRLIHDVLAGAQVYIGDSQTMACEAALLGTPSLRVNDFVGRIGYLDHLEHGLGLTFGFTPNQEDAYLRMLSIVVGDSSRKATWEQRRQAMLEESDDVNEVILTNIFAAVENVHA